MINIAIIGFGRWGEKLYDYFIGKEDISVKWIYNRTFVNIGRKEAFTVNLEDIINDNFLDIVFISTSVNSHYDLVVKLISYQNLIVEKPTFQSFSDFNKINKDLHEKIFTNYIFYYSKGINFFQEKIDLSADGPYEIVVNITQQNGNNDNVLNNLFCHVVSIVIKFGLYEELNSILSNININLDKDNHISIFTHNKNNKSITLISDSRTGVNKRRYIYIKDKKSTYYFDFKSDESFVYTNYDKQIPNNQSVQFFSEKDNLITMINASLDKTHRAENLLLSKKVMMVLDKIRIKL